MAALAVGVDVAKATLDVHIRPRARAFRVTNDAAGCRELVGALRALAAADLRICGEATGGLHHRAAAALAAGGSPVAVANPRQVRDFATAPGRRAKPDALDAAVLAHSADAAHPKAHPPPGGGLRLLRAFPGRRDQLLAMRAMGINRRAGVGDKRLQRPVENHVRWIDRQVEALDAEIGGLVAADPGWARADGLLRPIKGVGAQTARAPIGHLPELGRLGRRQIAHLVGLAPMACDSGASSRPRRVAGGRGRVREPLYMAALAAARCNPACRARPARPRAGGKAAEVALAAAARKLLCIADALARGGTPCRPAAAA